MHPSQDTLDEYVLTRLTDATIEQIEQHLLVCEQCQAAVEGIHQLIAALREAAAIERQKIIDIDMLRRVRTLGSLGASRDAAF